MANSEKPAPKKRQKPAPPSPLGAGNSDADAPLDPARLKKIADIKKALDEGTYHVSNEDVARKLIEHMLQPKK